jgi:branched-chain amino acid transport system substrate-binding protein
MMKRSERSWIGIALALAVVLGACSAPASSPTGGAAPAAPAKPAGGGAAPQGKPAAGTPGGALSGPPVKIGFIAPLSGPVAPYGAALKYAPALVVKEANESGGINGSPVELVTFDSPNNPNQTVTGLRRLVNDDKVVAILGPYYTGEMQAAVPLLKELKVPALGYTPAATHPGIVELNEWSFLADSSEERTVTIALDGFKKVNPNVRKVVVVGDNQTAVTAVTLRDVWPKVLPERGYEIVDTITFQFNTSDFTPIATRIRATGAEGIAISALSPAAPNLLQELERQGTHLPVVSSSHLQTVPPLAKIMGKTADGMVQTFFYSPEEAQKPRVQEWLAKYEAAVMAENPGGERPIIGYACEIQTYDEAAMLIQAMRNAGIKGDTPPAEAREKTRQALMNLKGFPGVLRSKDVTPTGRVSWDFYPLIAKDGALEAIN